MLDAGPLPPGPFAKIYADPAWPYKTFDGREVIPSRAAEQPYKPMPMADMMRLPVADVAAKNCALFMWVIDTHLDQALKLGKAWGFTFKTCAFIWIKTRPGGYPVPGMGHWTRKQTEQVWLFTRGRPKRLHADVEQIVMAPRGEHSAKPWLHPKIDRLVGGPGLEMFARQTQPGWEAWGDQVGTRDGSLIP